MAYYYSAKILNEYIVGSHVYGTNNSDSDTDYLVVVDGEPIVKEERLGENDFHYISKAEFDHLLNINHIKAIETIYSPSKFILKEKYKPNFKIDPIALRNTTSAICSNSWVKGKKKIQDGEINIGLKSFFHSIRIMEFSCQLLLIDNIVFDSMNWVWDELNALSNKNQDEILAIVDQQYKPMRNGIHTTFKELTNNRGYSKTDFRQ